jgi:N-acetylglucosaminyl-diphospho-decaprenol L-rhamnosyltransferase
MAAADPAEMTRVDPQPLRVQPDVSIIIVNWNTCALLGDCLEAVYRHMGDLSVEVIVIDNASTDGSAQMTQARFPTTCLVLNGENVGFARACNQAMAISSGRYMLLLNSDAQVTPGALRALVSLADAEPRAGVVGARLVFPDGTFQASHTRFPTLWQEFLILSGIGRLWRGRWYPSHGPEESLGPRAVDYVEGACLLARRQALIEVGGLDEAYFMYAEDVDWCYRMIQQGWQVWYQPAAVVIHHGGGSSQNRRVQREANLYRSRVRFLRQRQGDTAASLLKIMIFSLTAVKIATHASLRLLSGGRLGRRVVKLHELAAALRDV